MRRSAGPSWKRERPRVTGLHRPSYAASRLPRIPLTEIAYTVKATEDECRTLCDKMTKGASMFGYTTVEEWNKTHTPILHTSLTFVVYRVQAERTKTK